MVGSLINSPPLGSFTNALSLTLSLQLNIDVHFLSILSQYLASPESHPALLSWICCLLSSQAPMSFCNYCQRQPNPVLIHHFLARAQLDHAGEDHDTIGLVNTNQWSPTLNLGFLAVVPSFIPSKSFQKHHLYVIQKNKAIWNIDLLLPLTSPIELSSSSPVFTTFPIHRG